MSALYDKKAVKILFDTHWTATGWRNHYVTPPSDLAYAVGKGVMFAPTQLPHDASLVRLRALCDTISPSEVGDAFLASLGSRELALRSALGSFSVARFRPDHVFAPGNRSGACVECGLYLAPSDAQATNLNVLNFERLKWGGVRHTDTGYQIFDLEQFQILPRARPSDEDAAIFHRILATIRTLAPKATVGHFEKSLTCVFPSSKDERSQLISVLCLCGVLSYPGYRHYFDGTEPPAGRPYRDSDWGIPAMYWRAQDGYTVDALKEYFPRHAAFLATA